jgi:SAM-dependent methyltransferase
MSFYRDQLEAWLKTISVKAETVVDIGGGANPVSKRVAEWEAKNYQIFDNGLEAMKAEYLKLDINEDWEVIGKKNFADIVFCLEVYEYVFNPVQATKNIYNLLKNGGKAYISFPFVYPMHEPTNSDYLRYTPFGVTKLLSNAGFKSWKFTYRMDRSGLLESFYRADGMHPSKQVRNHNITGVLVEAIK